MKMTIRILSLIALATAGIATTLAHTVTTAVGNAGKSIGKGDVITVRPPKDVANRQGLRQFVGISEATAGAKGLSMNLVVIPPGAAAKPHVHKGYESAVYVLQGRVETRYGEGLRKSVINQKGDFLFIPPDVPHQPRNLSTTEPAMAIVARNDPNEQEHVFPYNPAD